MIAVEEKKVVRNGWLTDPTFISKVQYTDKEYLTQLFEQVYKYLTRCPIAVVSSWDHTHKSIYFHVGDNKMAFPVNTDIAYFDYVTQIDMWLEQFFPSYECEVVQSRPYTQQEIAELVAEGTMTIEEAFKAQKEDRRTEKGIITRIHVKDDTFKINIDGEDSIRHCDIPATIFIKTLRSNRHMPSNEIRAYIMSNSRFISKVGVGKLIEVDRDWDKMINFFKIQSKRLYKYPLEPLDDGSGLPWYTWYRYKILLQSDSLRKMCVSIYEKNKLIEEAKKPKEK
jgi:hypothetical protein